MLVAKIVLSSLAALTFGSMVVNACGDDSTSNGAPADDGGATGPNGGNDGAAKDAGNGTEGGGGDASCGDACSDGRVVLHDGWTLQSSSKITVDGAALSTRGYATTGWTPITVPTTVFAGLVANHAYPDPYIGDNLSTPPSLADGSWWYRTEFTLPADFAGRSAWLDLDGINYKANVWLNGKQIASADDVVGTFTAYEWDVTSAMKNGEPNALAIEIFPPDLSNDLALTWLDWNPSPPDRDMGIWRDVYVKKSGPVAVRGARVTSVVDPSLTAAHLTVKAEAHNTSDKPIHGTLRAAIDAIALSQDFDLAAGETKTITFAPAAYPALDIANPKLWWPAQMGAQDMYVAVVSADVAGATSDKQGVRFGIRDVTFEQTADGYRVFRINGKRILIRGGGWASDMMLRASPERLEAELQYVKDIGLNLIRLEGKLETDEFYSRADELGILTMPGWMCCDRWQAWDKWSATDHLIATASTENQARRLRNHPSVVDFLIGSDEAPPDDVETELLAALSKNDWPNPIGNSAANRKTTTLGESGVKMTGPYDWVAPSYWYVDKDHGGAFGFNTETGPGPAIPEIESLKAMLSPGELQDLWSKPDAQHYHAGTAGKQFDNLSLFNAALSARHGTPTSLEDYVRKAQLMNYEAERAPFEAYGKNKYAPATGIVHWMLNNAWPSLIWHLYENDLATSGAYFGAKKANETLHIQYSYDDNSIIVVNHSPAPANGMTASVRVYNVDASSQFSKDLPVDVAADDTTNVMTLPALPNASATYFVSLSLNRGGAAVSTNFYWLSTTAEVVDLGASDWFHAPTSQFADYKALSQLPTVNLQATATSEQNGSDGVTHVSIQNTSKSIAFFVRLALTSGKGGALVVPALWEDSYISLAPNEKRDIAVRYHTSDLKGAAPAVAISGWNVPLQTL